MSFLKSTLTVSGLTLTSRVFGFLRDVIMASILGAGPIADAFFVALKLPNFFRRITAEGAFSVSFVPLFSKAITQDGDAQASHFASQVLSWMIALMIPFVMIMLLAMPWAIHLIAPGFEESSDLSRFSLAVKLTRITFPYILLMSLTALIGGVLNSFGRFAPFASAPILFNASLVLSLLFLPNFVETVGHAMAIGVLASGFLQLFLVSYFVRKTTVTIKLVKPVLTAQVKRLFRLMGPGILGASIIQVNLLVDVILASTLPSGAVSYLYYADRLNQLPLGLIGIAIGTTLLPSLSQALSNDKKHANELFNQAVQFSFFLVLPATVALVMMPDVISHALFRQGAFSAADAKMTAHAMMAYASGLPAYIAIKILATSFYASEDTKTPMIVSAVGAVTNIVLSLALIQFLGHVGIALATAIAAWTQAGFLAVILRRSSVLSLEGATKKMLIKILTFSAAMGAVIYGVKATIGMWLPTQFSEKTSVILLLLLLVVLGKAVYFGCVLFTKTISISDIKNALQKVK